MTPCTLFQTILAPPPQLIWDFNHYKVLLPVFRFHIYEILQYVLCCVQLLLHNIHIYIVCIAVAFPFVTKQYSIVWIHHNFINSPTVRQQGFSQYMAIINMATINILLQVMVNTYESHSWVMGETMFNFITNCQTVLLSSLITTHSHHQCMRVPVTLYFHQNLMFSVFLILTIPESVQQHLSSFSLHNLITNNFEYFFNICLL